MCYNLEALRVYWGVRKPRWTEWQRQKRKYYEFVILAAHQNNCNFYKLDILAELCSLN